MYRGMKRLTAVLLAGALVFSDYIVLTAEDVQQGEGESYEEESLVESQDTTVTDTETDGAAEYVTGEVLVFYESDIVSEEEVETLARENDDQVKDTVVTADSTAVSVVELSDESTVAEAVESYTADERVEFAMPNYILETCEDEMVQSMAQQAVNDENYPSQWYLEQIHVPEAWDIIGQVPHEKVKVAVLDTGADISHPDLANIIDLGGSAEILSDAPDSTQGPLKGDGYQLGNVSGATAGTTHGTHVTGILGAQANNGIGIAGTASAYDNSVLDLMVIDIFPGAKTTFSYLFKGMEYARSQGAKVINLSLGINLNTASAEYQLLVQGCRKVFDSFMAEGITVVCAAGNGDSGNAVYDNGEITSVPGDLSSTISVINVDRNNNKSSTSNYGSMKDISAPGTDIWSTKAGASYGSQSGTSMAAPVVTGVAAMMLSVNPSLDPAAVKDILRATATDINTEGYDIYTGYGLVDAYKAVQEAAVRAGKLAEGEAQKPSQPSGGADQQPGGTQGNNADTALPEVNYKTHVQTYGWQDWVSGGNTSGTEGKAKRLEAIQVKLDGLTVDGGIQYKTHVQTYGWQDWVSDGAISGTEGEAKRLEAVCIRLTGQAAEKYDVYYRVHAQTYGWLDWAANGQAAGTSSYAKRLEAVQVVLTPKGGTPPGNTQRPYIHPLVKYKTHVQTYGWQGYVYDGKTSGTEGKAKRLEGLCIELDEPAYQGGIEYQAHIQTYGWEDIWHPDGEMSGTEGQAKRLEAVRIRLTGELEEKYDVYYRVHVQTYGWLGWAKNGEASGSEGKAKRLEGIQVMLVQKGGAAPGSTADVFRK